MQLQFVGATHGVTGSAHLLKACGKNILIDWGMRQGREEDISYDMPIPVNEIDAVLITHAHVDHIGALPEVKKALNAEFVYLGQGDEELYRSPDNHILPYLPPVANLPATTAKLDLPGLTLLLTPGHSAGGSCFYFPEQKLVISGDTLFAGSVGRTDLPGGSFAVLEKSIREKLLTLPIETTVYPGHDRETTIEFEKMNNMYLR
jgi:glyoxylase-like metal-dependent hydrolase (beta-lactamase superfamily II)